MKSIRVKRYKNRKFYDMDNSTYLTKSDILDVVLSGMDVVIVDDVSKKEITSKVLLTALAESEKFLDVDKVLDIIRSETVVHV